MARLRTRGGATHYSITSLFLASIPLADRTSAVEEIAPPQPLGEEVMTRPRRRPRGRGQGSRRRSLQTIVVPAACWTALQCWGCHHLLVPSVDASSPTATTSVAAAASGAGTAVNNYRNFAVPPPSPPPPPRPHRIPDAESLCTDDPSGDQVPTPTEAMQVKEILPPPPPPPPPPPRQVVDRDADTIIVNDGGDGRIAAPDEENDDDRFSFFASTEAIRAANADDDSVGEVSSGPSSVDDRAKQPRGHPPPPPPPARVLITAEQNHPGDTVVQVPPPPPRRPQDESNSAYFFGQARPVIVPPPPPSRLRQAHSHEANDQSIDGAPSGATRDVEANENASPVSEAHAALGESSEAVSAVAAQNGLSVRAIDHELPRAEPHEAIVPGAPPPAGLSPVGAGQAEPVQFESTLPRYGDLPHATREASRRPTDQMHAPSSQQRLQWPQQVPPKRGPIPGGVYRDHQGSPGQVPYRSMSHPSASRPGDQHAFRPRPMLHPPRPQIHQRGAAAGRSVAAAPAWRNVWRKIERGLDGLAGIEDVVTERAQQLYTSTISNVKLPVWKGTGDGHGSARPGSARVDARPLVSKQSSSQTVPTQPATAEDDYHFQLSRFDRSKRVQPTQSSQAGTTSEESESDDEAADLGKDVIPPNLYGALYRQSLRPPAQAGASKPRDTERDSARYDSTVPSQTKRLILATGGASVPHSVEPIPSSTDMQHDDLKTRDPRGPTNQGELRRPAASDFSTPLPSQRPPIPGTLNRGSSRSDLSTSKQELPSIASRPSTRPSSFNEDDEDGFLSRLGRLLPPIPRVFELKLNPFRRRDDYNDYSSAALDAWRDDDEKSLNKRGVWGFLHRPTNGDRNGKSLTSPKSLKDDTLTPALSDLMSRCQSGKGVSLLTRADEATCKAFGQTIAVTDFIKLASLLVVARQLSSFDFTQGRRLDEMISRTIPALIEGLLDSWVPFALVATLLAAKTNDLIRCSSLKSFLDSLVDKVGEEAHYASLYLRILSSSSTSKDTPSRIQASANKQALAKVERSRLRFLVACLLSTLVILTVTVLKSFVFLGLQCITRIANLPHWSHVSSQWRGLITEGSGALADAMTSAVALLKHELGKAAKAPIVVAFEAAIFVVVLALSFLPTVESKRKVVPAEGIDEEEEINEAQARFTDHVAELGGSSASRLDILSNGRAIESLLERWKFMQPTRSNNAERLASSSLLRMVGYRVVAAALLASPLIAFSYAGFTPHRTPLGSPLRWWESVFDISVIFFILYQIAGHALNACVVSKDAEGTVARFVSNLVGTTDDRREQVLDRTVDLQLQASISPTAGILVKDLWSAHTTRRAWAVRGANLACRNGEIVLLLGDAGSGKSRLLTSLAESASAPPRMAVTATRVRGSIAFGGVEASKWGKSQLIKRLGLFLSDVRTIADISRALSGLSIEEILEPSSGTRSFSDVSHNPASNERNAMMIALKITGLYSTLLPRLTSRLSTVVTANEEDLRPSSLRPRYTLLSSEEWSKLLIARVLSQAICDNENSASSHEKVDQCLIGSYLILDDATAYFSEVDETRFLQDLRRTGAAIVMASNRWATGRLADRILVLRDGAIVESGTHNELLNRGPQQSIYAAKWHAMSSI